MLQTAPGANIGSSSTGLGGKSPSIPQEEKQDLIRDSQESIESDESLHTTLLIESMTQEQRAYDEKVSALGKKVAQCLIVNSEKKSYSDVVRSIDKMPGYVHRPTCTPVMPAIQLVQSLLSHS